MSTLLPLCAVYDKKTGLYDTPFTVRHIAEAIREWDVVKKNENTKFAKHPEDYDLFQIGTFDYQTAQLTTLTPHTHLAGGI